MTLFLFALVLAGPCPQALDALQPPPEEALARWVVCLEIVAESRRAGVDEGLAVALALAESRLTRNVVSRRGALGPLQVIPGYWCPGRKAAGCDVVAAGVHALRVLGRGRSPADAVCLYNAGWRCGEMVCGPERCRRLGHRYAAAVVARARGFRPRSAPRRPGG